MRPSFSEYLATVEGPAPRIVCEYFEEGVAQKLDSRDFVATVRAYAAAITAAGLVEGDRVGLLAGGSPGYILVLLGTIASGAVIVPFEPRLSVNELARQLRETTPKLLFVAPQLRSLAEAASAGLPVRIVSDWAAFAAARRGGDSEIRAADQDATSLICYTSGSTGEPKGVLISWRAMAFQIERLGILFGSSNKAFLSVLPPNHLLELMCGMLAPLGGGGKIVFASTLKPSDLLELIERFRIGYMVAVPPLLKLLAPLVASAPPGPQFVGFVSGGAPLPERLWRAYNEHGISIFQGYGMTETCPVIAANYPGVNRVGTVGPPLPGIETRLTEESILEVRGPFSHGYYSPIDPLRRAEVDDWISTGDIAEFDEAGFLRILGRSNERIVLPTGKKVQPEEVEVVLSAAPGVEELCIVGAPSEFEGCEEVVAIVRPNAALQEQNLDRDERFTAMRNALRTLRPQLADYKFPSRIILADDPFPRSSTQKVLRAQVRDQYCR